MDDDPVDPFAHDAALTAKMEAAGHKLVMTLGQWRDLDDLQWDVLGEYLVVRFRAGPPDRPAIPVSWAIPHALAKDLLPRLAQALEERDSAAAPMQ